MKVNIKIDRRSRLTIQKQLYEQIRQLILNGDVHAGERFPSSRELADQLRVSRPTVALVFAQLRQEGYLEMRPSSGTFVCERLEVANGRGARKHALAHEAAALSTWGSYAARNPVPEVEQNLEISFYPWRPALDEFPLTQWARILGRQARRDDLALLDLNFDHQGCLPLRKALAGLVERFRGVRANANQIVVVSGLSQGLDLVARMHMQKGSRVAVENPGWSPAWRIFESQGAQLVHVPVDDEGACVERLAKEKRIALSYVMPAHQFPSGATMTVARRLEFLKWARATGGLVLEDDYDSEYQAQGKPVPALMTLDQDARVIYLGSLNQLMFPSLGLAYLILPPQFVQSYTRARRMAGEQLPFSVQLAIAQFIDEGHLDRHVKRLRAIYRGRRQALVSALRKALPDGLSISGDRAGIYLLLELPGKLSAQDVCRRAAQAGVGVIDTDPFYKRKPARQQLMLGFGNLSEKQIEEGVRRLARIIR